MAKHVQPCSTFAESVIHVEGQVQPDEEQRAELFGRESGLWAGGKAGEISKHSWSVDKGGKCTLVAKRVSRATDA